MAQTHSKPSLEPRQRPAQRRGRETVDRVLDATATLLERDGFEALTTNKIAQEAVVNVSSLYKYFPNKYAILKALSERNLERQLEIVVGAIQGLGDWREVVSRGIDVFMDYYLAEPASAPLADAFRVSPVLREHDAAGSPALRKLVVQQLQTIGVRGGKKDVEAMAHVVMESAAAVLNVARLMKPADRKRLIEQLKIMLVGYISENSEAK